MENWWNDITNNEIDLRLYDCIFGLLNQNDERLNFIILPVKYHIHKNIIDGVKEITWRGVCKKYVKFKVRSLQFTMTKRNQIKQFNDDWKCILDAL